MNEFVRLTEAPTGSIAIRFFYFWGSVNTMPFLAILIPIVFVSGFTNQTHLFALLVRTRRRVERLSRQRFPEDVGQVRFARVFP